MIERARDVREILTNNLMSLLIMVFVVSFFVAMLGAFISFFCAIIITTSNGRRNGARWASVSTWGYTTGLNAFFFLLAAVIVITTVTFNFLIINNTAISVCIFLGGVTIAVGGVLQNIHTVLMQNNDKGSKVGASQEV